MSVTSSQGDKVVRQSKDFVTYNSGEPNFWAGTVVLGSATSGIRKRCGIFDGKNGPFFEQDENGNLNFGVLSTTSGSTQVEHLESQTNWSIDPLDGSEGSAFNIQAQNILTPAIDYTWYGPGEIRFGFLYKGRVVWVHKYNVANTQPDPWGTTPELPSRYEIENVSGSTSGDSMDQGASAIIQEGANPDNRGVQRAVNTPVGNPTTISATSFTNVIAVRPKENFNGQINRQVIDLISAKLFVSGEEVLWELIYDPTISATWTSVSSNSFAEFAIAADITSASGGEKLDADIVSGGKEGKASDLSKKTSELVAARGIDPANYDSFLLRGQALNNKSTTGWGIMKWREQP
jgi:hypothetical protein